MAINKLIAGAKGAAGNSTGAEIAETVNGIILQDYSPVKQRFLEALESDTPFTYIVAGDSTRNSDNNGGIGYYSEQLSKINFTAVNNARAGWSASEWINASTSNVYNAISATPGTGSTAILEMSLGINYEQGQTIEDIKQDIIEGLDIYLAEKPDAKILLVSPVKANTLYPSQDYEDMYAELAELYSTTWVSGLMATVGVIGDQNFYTDETHPNRNGYMRMVNYIMSRALPSKCATLMTMDNSGATQPESYTVTPVVESGYWKLSNGAATASSDWRRLQEIEVEAGFVFKIDHGGNEWVFVLMDEDRNVVQKYDAENLPEYGVNGVVVGNNVKYIRANVSSQGEAYDALGYTVVTEYLADENGYFSQERLNAGNFVPLPTYTPNYVDAFGRKGKVGQVQTPQDDGTWLWV